MSQFRHFEESDWEESSEGNHLMGNHVGVAPSIVLELPLVVPVSLLPKSSDAVLSQPHIVLSCSAYDDDEECEE